MCIPVAFNLSVRAAELPDVRLEILGPSTIGFGKSLKYRLTVTNDTDDTVTVGNELSLHSVASDVDQEFKRVVWTIPPGGSEVLSAEVDVGHWFSEPGRYRLQTSEGVFHIDRSAAFRLSEPVRRPVAFEDVTAEAGLQMDIPGSVCGSWTAGAAWGDIDGDDDLDLFVPDKGSPSKLFVNGGSTFVDEAEARGVAGGDAQSLGAVFADYDNDADQDLFVTNLGTNFLYENDGTGNFIERAAEAGVAGAHGPNQSASWGDYDGDGSIDLYVSRHVICQNDVGMPHPDVLYHNDGDGTFTDVTALLEREGSTNGAGFQALWFDYDSDGDLDIYLGNDYYGAQPQPNVFWRNDGLGEDGQWTFTNVSSASGAGLIVNSMGLAPLDHDRDGDTDVAISNIYDPIFLRNRGDGTFAESHGKVGLTMPALNHADRPVTWGVVPGDLNLDGYEDLYFPSGSLSNEPLDNFVYLNDGRGAFLDMTGGSGAVEAASVSRGTAIADYDRDGRLDLFVVNQAGEPHLLRNVTPRGKRQWLQVLLTGGPSNRDACGASLVLVTEKAKLVRVRYCGGVGLGSGHDPAVHFGLGAGNAIRKLKITWPSGTRQVVTDIQPNSLVNLAEPT